MIETKKTLLDAALDLFSTNGFNGTSVRDIAQVTGMTAYNIYYHFGNKDGLLLAVFNQLSDELLAEFKSIIELALPPLERFEKLVKTHLDGVIRNKKKGGLLFLDEEVLTPAAYQISKQFQLSILNIYRRELQNLLDGGYIRSQNITVMAFNILAIIQWHFRWFKPNGTLSYDEIKNEAFKFIMDGIST